ncbi:hypothetical protein FRACA_20034 [Frankia canadensis]|uniref:Uncharacterized protein n=1 Tax=Frankia canadensis TaxID=1836972 RepID=A0A2I2KPP4_9ACTN|nr:hypothetical protein FRACA_20034 [Frankia canadensis]SOU54928.1 hypothetical protein FRACA_20034 [Frankia canadensis]
MLRTALSLPLTGLSTLGFDPARFQTKPPACYRASWQLPGPDSHRQATTGLRQSDRPLTRRHLPSPGHTNKVHYVRDVSFGEDASTLRTGNIPTNIATLRSTVINRLRRAGYQFIPPGRRGPVTVRG